MNDINPGASESRSSSGFPWKGSVLATLALVLGTGLVLEVAPALAVVAWKLVLLLAYLVVPQLKGILLANSTLVEAVLSQVIYIFSFGVAITLLKRIVAPGRSLLELTSAGFEKLRSGFGRSIGMGIVGYVVAMLLVAAMYTVLPLPSPQSPAGDYARTLSGPAIAAFAFGAIILAPILEELLFRGLIFNMLRSSLREKLSPGIADFGAVIVSGAFFSAMHMTLTGFPVLFITGVVLGEVYRRTNSLHTSIIMHMINNTIATLALVASMS